MCCTPQSSREAETELRRGLELAGFFVSLKKKKVWEGEKT